MKDKIFSVLQRVGRSFMLPIAILPVAGLLLGIGSSFTNATTIETYGLTSLLGNGTILHALLVIMNKVGSAVFDNLPLIFAVGVAIGMAKKEKEVSALSAVIAYFVMNTAINAMLTITGQILENGEIAESVLEGTITSVCGIQSLQMGVFGGIIVGLGVAALHNRFYRIQLPNALSFFGGTRFVPIISTIVYMFVGILMYFVWPVVQNGIYALGGLVTGSGYVGTLIFGLIKRALIPLVCITYFICRSGRRQSEVPWKWQDRWCRADRIFSSHSLRILRISHISVQMQRDISPENLFL